MARLVGILYDSPGNRDAIENSASVEALLTLDRALKSGTDLRSLSPSPPGMTRQGSAGIARETRRV